MTGIKYSSLYTKFFISEAVPGSAVQILNWGKKQNTEKFFIPRAGIFQKICVTMVILSIQSNCFDYSFSINQDN